MQVSFNKFRRMQHQGNLKREFLKNWLIALQSFNSFKVNKMTFCQRKRAVKLSADLAMASTRNSTTSWSRALISKANEDEENGNLAKKISAHFEKVKCLSSSKHNKLITKFDENVTRASFSTRTSKIGKIRKYVSRKYGPYNRYKVKSRSIAKRIVEKRTQFLKGLVPGGECMDECSLIKETLDYIVSLRAQVDVMQCLANSHKLVNYY